MAGQDARSHLVLRQLNRAAGALLVGTSFVSWQSRQQEMVVTRAHARTSEYLRAAKDVEIATLQMIRGERGFLLSGDPEYLEPYSEGRRQIDDAMARLRAVTRGDSLSSARVDVLEGKARAYAGLLDRVVALARSERRADALAIIESERERAAIEDIRKHLLTMNRKEQFDLAVLREQWRDKLEMQRLFFYLVTLVGVALVALASLSVVTLRRVAARERVYREELRRLAETDELTGLANRRELVSALKRALAETERRNGDLAFALLDIDHFKRVNDTWGHPAGDQVIRAVADAAMACVRGGDLVGRLGGEEFGIVLPGAGVAQAWTVCERVRQRVQASPIMLADGTAVSVTVSAGIARRFDGDCIETILERSDAALYQAKNSGRDQVRLAA